MTGKFNFTIENQDRRRALPHKIIVGQDANETVPHVILKLFAFLIFYRDRLQFEPRLHDDNIPFVPDLVQLDYELRPILWIECGECSVGKLQKLAVKIPYAEIWIVKESKADADRLIESMEKLELRRGRYQILVFDDDLVPELCKLLQTRNEIMWVCGEFEPPNLQFDFNSLWFDTPFTVLKF